MYRSSARRTLRDCRQARACRTGVSTLVGKTARRAPESPGSLGSRSATLLALRNRRQTGARRSCFS